MRRTFILSTVLAASVAVIGACSSTATVPNKPAPTPAPVTPASPISSPVASPVASPAKPVDEKKTDDKTAGKDVKPVSPATPIAK